MEIWKDIEGYEGIYQVSNEGNVRSCEREIEYLVKGKYKGKRVFPSVLLKTWINNGGYVLVDLYMGGKTDKRTIHRLVAEAFIPNTDNKPCIDHINGDKTDNRVENLRWCTYKENMNNPITIEKLSKTMKNIGAPWLHSEEANEKRKNKQIGRKLSNKTKEKISEANSKPIYQYNLNGELIAIYKNSVVASKETKFPQAQINKHAHGKYYSKERDKWYFKNEYKGYRWSFYPL
jgi:hypothetical protein